MIEGIVSKGLEVLISQGSGWIVAVILGAWAVTLDKRVIAMQSVFDAQIKDANRAIQDQYEKRLGEFRELLDVMTNSTSSIKAMHGSISTTTEAINQLAQGFSKLTREFESQQGKWDDKGGVITKQMEDIKFKIERLQREVQR